MIEVVAALIWDNGKFMICQRPANKARAFLWEFVGGKVEPGETKEQALIRECQEELDITISVGDVFMEVTHVYPDITVHLTLFNSTIAEGIPQKLEHNDIHWITPAEICNYDFCPADEEILQKIIAAYWKLPDSLIQDISRYLGEHYIDFCASESYAENMDIHFGAVCESAVPKESACSYPLPSASLQAFLDHVDAGFTETLLNLIDRTGKKDSEIYKKALLSKQHFSKIRNNPNYKPTKPTAIALALALELDLEETKDLIGRAGYALTNSSKFDLIIRYFIEQGNYNVVEINMALYEFDQPLLGA